MSKQVHLVLRYLGHVLAVIVLSHVLMYVHEKFQDVVYHSSKIGKRKQTRSYNKMLHIRYPKRLCATARAMHDGFEFNHQPRYQLCTPSSFSHLHTMASDDCSEKCSTRKPSTIPTSPVPTDAFNHLVRGYPMLAGRTAVLPEIAMYRRFGALNARNLLYLQSDLCCLEEELIELEKADSISSIGKKRKYAVNAYWLNTAHQKQKDGSLRDGDTRQRDLFLRIRQTLNEYSASSIPLAWSCR